MQADNLHKIRDQMRPLIRGYVHIYNYSELKDFTEEHLEKIYGELLSCPSFDMALFHEIACIDEYITGVCMGYIFPDDMKAALMERITDYVWTDLNKWVEDEYEAEMKTKNPKSEPELHEVMWESEMRARANDHNNSR